MTDEVYARGVIRGAAGSARWAVSADRPAAHVDPDDWWFDGPRLANLVGAHNAAVTGSVHGARVAVVRQAGVAQGCDAIVTEQMNLALVALAVDCVPVVLADPDRGLVAAVHCGWRGLTAGVVTEAVSSLVANGAEAVMAVVGPSICADCYPVPIDRLGEMRKAVRPQIAEQACFDDPARIAVGPGVIAELQLLTQVEGIEVVPGCTAEDARLFSYRRSGSMKRHAMVIAATARSAGT
ncbi:MAG: polyphenol oxidase family protein [Actinomycetales bacterium]